MKYIQISLILCATLVCFPIFLKAQTIAENDTVTINSQVEPGVEVAYRNMPQGDILGGVSVINMEELMKKNAYVGSLEGYISGFNGSSLWGMDDLLILVDGIPRDLDNVMPSEISQITFLKGAAAVVLYGSRGAKGVVSITTKRGKAEPLSLNVRANTGFYVSKSYPKYLGSAEYMTLYNEALENDGADPLYSEEDIYHYASGENPYRYPNVDFYSDEYLKKASNLSDITAEISGGEGRARFYTNIGYYRQDDVFKFGEAKNNYIDRLNIRGNIDLQINDKINAYVNANATFYNAREANVSDSDDSNYSSYWTSAATMRPNRVAPLIPISYIDPNDLTSQALIESSSNIIDGKYFLSGRQSEQNNVFADYYAAGNSKWTSRQFQFDTGLDFDLDKTLNGLTFHTKFAVDYATSYTTSYNNSYAIFVPDWYSYNGEDVIAGLTKYNNDEKSGSQNISGSSDRQTIAFSGYFTYEKSINDAHNFSAILLAGGYQRTQSSVYHKTNNTNLGLLLGYNYKGKYYVDFGAAEVYSTKLAEGNRTAFSPSLTLGWKLDKEGFVANSSVIDNLMLSVSGSILNTDMDIDDHYLYESNYTQSDGAWWGWYDGASERSTNSRRGGNADLTFIKRKELSANVKTSFWDRLITLDASVFVNSMEGLIIEPLSIYPLYFTTDYPEASFIPYVNYNNDKTVGFDFDINLNKQIGAVDFTMGLVGMYYTNKATQRDENIEYDYQSRVGQPINGIWGLESAGFFQSQEEIDNAPEQVFDEVKPGDIRYVDQNNDGIIDNKDEVFLGRSASRGAPLTMGLNLTAKWKNLTLFALCTGYFGANSIKNGSYYWVSGEGKYSEVVRGRWTEETRGTATYPRLTTESGVNNFRNSDFWMFKTNRMNLSRVQLTYDFPKDMLTNSFINEISAYVSGTNLLTIACERDIMELNITSAPQTRFFNIGVKAAF